MYVVCVHVHVKMECRDAFLQASLENAKNTVKEPGNLRFDVLQEQEAPDRFLLYEVYRDESGMQAHKQTAHYANWSQTVAPFMAEARYGLKYTAHFPEAEPSWKSHG